MIFIFIIFIIFYVRESFSIFHRMCKTCFYFRYMVLFLSTNALLGKTTFAMHTSRSVRWDIIEDKGFSTILRKEGLENFLEGGGLNGKGVVFMEYRGRGSGSLEIYKFYLTTLIWRTIIFVQIERCLSLILFHLCF